jgi:formyl-CoA transferase
VQRRTGNVVPFAAPRNAYQTSDQKWIAISCSTQSTTKPLLEAIGQPELIDDPRFHDNASRVENVEALDAVIAGWMLTHTYDDATAILQKHGVTAGPVYTAADLFRDEHVRARGSIVATQDEDLGELWMQAPIPRLTESPGAIAFAGRKTPGADNREVFAELGLPAQIEEDSAVQEVGVW